jgi:hypothetical protein
MEISFSNLYVLIFRSSKKKCTKYWLPDMSTWTSFIITYFLIHVKQKHFYNCFTSQKTIKKTPQLSDKKIKLKVKTLVSVFFYIKQLLLLPIIPKKRTIKYSGWSIKYFINCFNNIFVYRCLFSIHVVWQTIINSIWYSSLTVCHKNYLYIQCFINISDIY